MMLQYPSSLGSCLCSRSANFLLTPMAMACSHILSGSVGQGISRALFATPLHRQFQYLQTFLRTEIWYVQAIQDHRFYAFPCCGGVCLIMLIYYHWQRHTPTHRSPSYPKSRIHDLQMVQAIVLSKQLLNSVTGNHSMILVQR